MKPREITLQIPPVYVAHGDNPMRRVDAELMGELTGDVEKAGAFLAEKKKVATAEGEHALEFLRQTMLLGFMIGREGAEQHIAWQNPHVLEGQQKLAAAGFTIQDLEKLVHHSWKLGRAAASLQQITALKETLAADVRHIFMMAVRDGLQQRAQEHGVPLSSLPFLVEANVDLLSDAQISVLIKVAEVLHASVYGLLRGEITE